MNAGGHCGLATVHGNKVSAPSQDSSIKFADLNCHHQFPRHPLSTVIAISHTIISAAWVSPSESEFINSIE